MARLAKKTGKTASPVILNARKIAATFWGGAWCDNLEAYSDFANRLPRGRTYVRNGSVVDLQIGPGTVTARVSGSELYRVKIQIKPLASKVWKSIQGECAGKIDSLLELLQGKLSSAVMQVVTRQAGGLFPAPGDIELDCSCPDWADLCKHVAAALYGVGARLDSNPELLFVLRGVDPADLISKASAAEAVRQTVGSAAAAPVMSEAEMADVFGIELANDPGGLAVAGADAPPVPAPGPARSRKRQPKRGRLGAPPRARFTPAAKAKSKRVKARTGNKPRAVEGQVSARAKSVRTQS